MACIWNVYGVVGQYYVVTKYEYNNTLCKQVVRTPKLNVYGMYMECKWDVNGADGHYRVVTKRVYTSTLCETQN